MRAIENTPSATSEDAVQNSAPHRAATRANRPDHVPCGTAFFVCGVADSDGGRLVHAWGTTRPPTVHVTRMVPFLAIACIPGVLCLAEGLCRRGWVYFGRSGFCATIPRSRKATVSRSR